MPMSIITVVGNTVRVGLHALATSGRIVSVSQYRYEKKKCNFLGNLLFLPSPLRRDNH